MDDDGFPTSDGVRITAADLGELPPAVQLVVRCCRLAAEQQGTIDEQVHTISEQKEQIQRLRASVAEHETEAGRLRAEARSMAERLQEARKYERMVREAKKEARKREQAARGRQQRGPRQGGLGGCAWKGGLGWLGEIFEDIL